MGSRKHRTIQILGLIAATSLLTYAVAFGTQGSTNADGAKIFKAQCSGCHGDKAQGGAGYSKPLAGKLSSGELVNYIQKYMPPGGKRLSTKDAKAVGEYVYNEFYSTIAQERNRPPRVELVRLTVNEFKNSVADLLRRGSTVELPGTVHGLQGQYFKARNFDSKTKIIDRLDSEIQFDYGNAGPNGGDFDPYNFSIIWNGSILAPDSGQYEFVIKTDNAVRLFVNGNKPAIDAFIRSGNEREFHATVDLLAGRLYPIRIEFSKATQGVEDPKRQKEKPPGHAGIELQWRRPKQTLETVPNRFLYNQGSSPTFVLTTQFPPDDRSMGYERGNSVSKEWQDATTQAAIDTATYIADNLNQTTRVPENDPDAKNKLIEFSRKLVTRAFRSPLTPEVEQTYITSQFQKAPNLETAVKRVVLMTLLSPRFLYREIGGDQNDPYRVAADLSFGMWDSIPSDELEQAAKAGNLNSPEQILAAADRMANDPRTWAKVERFFWQWMKVDDVPELVKSSSTYPTFNPGFTTDLRSSLEVFLENTAWGEKGSFRELMTSPNVFLNSNLAKTYGADVPPKSGFMPVALDGGTRTGILSQPYLLAKLGYLETSSPIHRGVLIIRNFLGRTLNPPPSAFAPDPASLHPGLTTRERVALQTKPEMCNNCHGMINPLGFTLERFDSIGRSRTEENGKKIDSSGSYRDLTGGQVKFSDYRDLAKYIVESDEGQEAFVEKFFQNIIRQPVRAYGKDATTILRNSFTLNQQSIRKLMVQVVALSASRRPKGGN